MDIKTKYDITKSLDNLAMDKPAEKYVLYYMTRTIKIIAATNNILT